MKKDAVAASIAQREGSLESKERRSMANRVHGEKLSRLMEAAILALIESRTFKEAAAKVGVAESTLRRWYRDPVFREHYDATRRHILEAGTMEIADLKLEGIRVLGEELRDWSNPAIRHAAAKFVVTLPDRELQRLDAERRFNASQEKIADKQRGDLMFLEVLEHYGMTVAGFLDLVSAAQQKRDPEVPDHEEKDAPPAAEAARSSQIGADRRHDNDDNKERSDPETLEHGGYRDGRQRPTSAQAIADDGRSEDSHVKGNGRPPTTVEEPTGDGGARDDGTSAQIDADARKTDGTDPVGDPTTRHHTENEDKPRPRMIRRRSAPMTAADDLRQAHERERTPSQNQTSLLSAEREEGIAGEEGVASALRETRLLTDQVRRERYPEAR